MAAICLTAAADAASPIPATFWRCRPSADVDCSQNRSSNRGKADIHVIRSSSSRNRLERTYERSESNGMGFHERSEDRWRTIAQSTPLRTDEAIR